MGPSRPQAVCAGSMGSGRGGVHAEGVQVPASAGGLRVCRDSSFCAKRPETAAPREPDAQKFKN